MRSSVQSVKSILTSKKRERAISAPPVKRKRESNAILNSMER
jgi:hypothetical protein